MAWELWAVSTLAEESRQLPIGYFLSLSYKTQYFLAILSNNTSWININPRKKRKKEAKKSEWPGSLHVKWMSTNAKTWREKRGSGAQTRTEEKTQRKTQLLQDFLYQIRFLYLLSLKKILCHETKSKSSRLINEKISLSLTIYPENLQLCRNISDHTRRGYNN